MNIYKEDVLEAIETEPLGFGSFAVIQHNKEVCSMCIVGAIIKGTGIRPEIIIVVASEITAGLGDITPRGFGYLPPRAWPNALSYLWESLGKSNTPVNEARVIIHDWVEENVPEDEVLFTVQSN